MATIAEIKFDIINTIRPRYNSDDLISEKFVEYLIRLQRSLWLRNKIREFQYVPENAKQSISCINLIDVSEAECCDVSYSECTVKRTENKIPQFIDLINGPAISRISSIYLNEKKTIQYVSRNRSPFIGLNKYNKNMLYAFLKDGYIYIVSANCTPKINLKMISFEGVFEDPLEVANLNNCNGTSCFDSFKDQYPIPSNMIPYIKEQIINQLIQSIKMPVDVINDSSEIIKQ